jgi:hypothetical protein
VLRISVAWPSPSRAQRARPSPEAVPARIVGRPVGLTEEPSASRCWAPWPRYRADGRVGGVPQVCVVMNVRAAVTRAAGRTGDLVPTARCVGWNMQNLSTCLENVCSLVAREVSTAPGWMPLDSFQIHYLTIYASLAQELPVSIRSQAHPGLDWVPEGNRKGERHRLGRAMQDTHLFRQLRVCVQCLKASV